MTKVPLIALFFLVDSRDYFIGLVITIPQGATPYSLQAADWPREYFKLHAKKNRTKKEHLQTAAGASLFIGQFKVHNFSRLSAASDIIIGSIANTFLNCALLKRE